MVKSVGMEVWKESEGKHWWFSRPSSTHPSCARSGHAMAAALPRAPHFVPSVHCHPPEEAVALSERPKSIGPGQRHPVGRSAKSFCLRPSRCFRPWMAQIAGMPATAARKVMRAREEEKRMLERLMRVCWLNGKDMSVPGRGLGLIFDGREIQCPGVAREKDGSTSPVELLHWLGPPVVNPGQITVPAPVGYY